jgi:hypothetical protein
VLFLGDHLINLTLMHHLLTLKHHLLILTHHHMMLKWYIEISETIRIQALVYL